MNGLMVVDDEEGVRRSLKKVLEKDGYRIILAQNGEEAISMVRYDNRDIETVISDYRMPGIDGLETLIEIGRLGLWRAGARRQLAAAVRLGARVRKVGAVD